MPPSVAAEGRGSKAVPEMQVPEVERMTPKEQLHSLVLDFLYKRVCQGKSNQQIFKDMERTPFPPIDNDQMNMLREEFKQKELTHPERMAEFRRRLKV